MRVKYTLRCTVCKMENYIGKKNKTEHPEKVENVKYCSRCNKRTSHKETKTK